MADLSLDDELLMLAAGGSPSEEGEADSQKDDGSIHSRSPSRSPAISRSPSRSPPRSLSASQPNHQVSTSEKKMAHSGEPDHQQRSESEDEGEALSGANSPHSLGSDAMDESDSDDGSDAGDITRPHIAGETAFEREKRLAEQAEHEEERLKTAQLKALLTRADSKSAKRKAADVEEDDYGRRAARQRTKKDDGESSRRVASGRKDRKYRDVSQSPLNDRDVQVQRDDGQQPGSLQEFERVRVGRTNFPQICFFPGFEDSFVGTYARVCHSQDPVTGQNIYRMCQIKDFKTGKPYKLQASQDRAYMTDQYLVASYGSLDKEYPFAACSDSKFTEDEYHRRNQMLESQGIKPSTSAFLYKKCGAINDFLGKNWTSAQITQKVENQRRLSHLLTGPATAAVGPRTLQRDYALQRRNEQNRKLNEEQVRNALIAERKRRQMLQQEAAKKRKAEEERKKKAEIDGLFGDDSAKEEESGKPKPISRYAPKDYTGKKGLSEFSRLRTDDEIIASMDFGIDIEI